MPGTPESLPNLPEVPDGKSPPEPEERDPPSDKKVPNQRVERALVIDAILDELWTRENGSCTSDQLHSKLRKFGISKHKISRILDEFGKLRRYFQYRPERHEIGLSPMLKWSAESNMVKRVDKPSGALDKMAQVFGKEIVSVLNGSGSPAVFFDAGSSTLACVRHLGNALKNWNILTNNLVIAMDLLGVHHPKCRLPPGRVDTHTAAIIESQPEDLDGWFEDNGGPDVGVIAFHYVRIRDDKVISFDVEQKYEIPTKRAATMRSTKSLFILADKSKIKKKKQGAPAIQIKEGRWLDAERSTKEHEIEITPIAQRIFFITDCREDEIASLQLDVLRDQGVEVLTTG